MTKRTIWVLGMLVISGVLLFPPLKRLAEKHAEKHRRECDCEKHFVDYKEKMEQFYKINERAREYQKQHPGFDLEGEKLMLDWDNNNPADSIRFQCVTCLSAGYKPPRDLYEGYETFWVPTTAK